MKTFYRLLNEGEPIQQGDEVANAGWDQIITWEPVIGSDLTRVCSSQGFYYRRPLGSETCDHVTGVSAMTGATGYWLGAKGNFISLGKPDESFNFCPLCGMPLEVSHG